MSQVLQNMFKQRAKPVKHGCVMLSHKAHLKVDASFSYRFSSFPMLQTDMSENLVATYIFEIGIFF